MRNVIAMLVGLFVLLIAVNCYSQVIIIKPPTVIPPNYNCYPNEEPAGTYSCYPQEPVPYYYYPGYQFYYWGYYPRYYPYSHGWGYHYRGYHGHGHGHHRR